MQRAGGHAELAQGGDLIVHQRDQRRNDHRGAGTAQGRHLVAQALAAAGRHQHQRVAAGEHMVDYRFLRTTKAGKAEDTAENALGIVDRRRLHQQLQHGQCPPTLISTRLLSCEVSAKRTDPWPRPNRRVA